jgi:hypothetical protein
VYNLLTEQQMADIRQRKSIEVLGIPYEQFLLNYYAGQYKDLDATPGLVELLMISDVDTVDDPED